MNDFESFWQQTAGLGSCAPEFLSDAPTSRWRRFKNWFESNRNAITNVTKWLATAIMLIAAMCVSFDLRPYHIWFLNIGSAAWLITALLWREWSLIIVNSALLLVYFIGFIKTL